MKRLLPLYIAIFSMLALQGVAYGAGGQNSSFNLTTHHASPLGKYEQLNFPPRADLATPCDVGTMYTNMAGAFQYCESVGLGFTNGVWREVDVGVWKAVGSDVFLSAIDDNPDLFVGIGTEKPKFRLSIGDGGGGMQAATIMSQGFHGAGEATIPAETGPKFVWFPRKSSFRAGETTLNNIWGSNNGDYSVAFGQNNRAAGRAAVIAGGGNAGLMLDNHVRGNHGAIGGGNTNSAIGEHTTVGGGFTNRAGFGVDAPKTTVIGGDRNDSLKTYATTLGGSQNRALADQAFVGGGQQSVVNGNTGTIIGGQSNISPGDYGTVIGGARNNAQGKYAVVGGGYGNHAIGTGATVVGGGDASSNPNNQAVGKYATVVGGEKNSADNEGAVIIGGSNNSAAKYSVVGGGADQTNNGDYSAIGGGSDNVLSNTADYAAILGGENGSSPGAYSAIHGGKDNNLWNDYAVIGGGEANNVQGQWGAIGGGKGNRLVGTHTTIVGGEGNQVNAKHSVVIGGKQNEANGTSSVVGGGGGLGPNIAKGNFSVVGAGYVNVVDAESGSIMGGSRNTIDANAKHSTILGGKHNHIKNSPYTFIGGGGEHDAVDGNTADTGTNNTILGGSKNKIIKSYVSIGGGFDNLADHDHSSVGGGLGNRATSGYASVGGGELNESCSHKGTVLGGKDNVSWADAASITTGESNRTGAQESWAGGRKMYLKKTTADNSFIWGYSSGAFAEVNTSNAFIIYGTDGKPLVGIGRDDPKHPIHAKSDAHLSTAGKWVDASSRELKEQIEPINETDAFITLAKLEPITYRYKEEPEDLKVGFIAEDVPEFVAEADRKSLSAMNITAVLTKVVQEHQKQLEQRKQELQAMKEELEQLQR